VCLLKEEEKKGEAYSLKEKKTKEKAKEALKEASKEASKEERLRKGLKGKKLRE